MLNLEQVDFRSVSFQELLEAALNHNHQKIYALAMGKSREAEPTSRSIEMSVELIKRKGTTWRQILHRQSVKNFDLVFRTCNQCSLAMGILAQTAHYMNNMVQLEHITLSLFHQLKTSSNTVWFTLSKLIDGHAQTIQKHPSFHKAKDHLFGIFQFINQQSWQQFNILLQQLFQRHVSEELQMMPKDQQFTDIMNIYLHCSHLFKTCRNIRQKELKGLIFIQQNKQATSFFRDCVFDKCFKYIQHYLTQLGAHDNHMYIGYYLCSHAFQCLQNLAQIPELHPLILNRVDEITELLLSFPILSQSQKAQQIYDDLNKQYGLVSLQFGDDISSYIASTIFSLSQTNPCILRKMLTKIKNIISSNPSDYILSQMLIRLQILHKLVLTRTDFPIEIVTEIIGILFNGTYQQECSMATDCRKLRLMLLYGQILSQTHFNKLISTTLSLLKIHKSSSYPYHQAQNIFSDLVRHSNHAQQDQQTLSKLPALIKQNAPMIISQIMDTIKTIFQQGYQYQDAKIYMLLSNLLDFVTSNQHQAKSNAIKIVGWGSVWLYAVVEAEWQRGKKHHSILDRLAKLITLGVQITDEQLFLNMNEHLYKVLFLLKQPQNIQISDELILLLFFVIDSFNYITPELCQLLTTLQNLVNFNGGSLYCIADILKVLNKKSIAPKVIFQYPELPPFISTLYLDYFNHITPQEQQLYISNIGQIYSYFQIFLQSYKDLIEQNPTWRNHLLHQIRTMKKNEWSLRFLFILYHISPKQVVGYDFYTRNQMTLLTKRTSLKLAFMYYANKMYHHYVEYLLDQIGQLHRYFLSIRNAMKFQKDEDMCSIFPEIKPRVFVKEVLRELKKRRQIDLADLVSLSNQLHLQ